jgi:hypothetical protein
VIAMFAFAALVILLSAEHFADALKANGAGARGSASSC